MKLSKLKINPNDFVIVTANDYSFGSQVRNAVASWLMNQPNMSNVRVELITHSSSGSKDFSISVLTTSSIDEIFEREVLNG